jgi:hypothetical protein
MTLGTPKVSRAISPLFLEENIGIKITFDTNVMKL